MPLVNDLKMYGRFSRGLLQYAQQTLTLPEAERIVAERLAQRESLFLRMVERGIYGNPTSPYLALLREAACSYGDVEQMVAREGVEATLAHLRAAGVYVTFETFKGRRPLERGSLSLPTQATDFDNPFLAHHFYTETGGSTGRASRIAHDLDHHAATAPHHLLLQAAQGVLDAPMALWRGVLPDGSGINNILRSVRFRSVPEKWFSHISLRDSRHPLKYALGTYLFVLAGRLGGVPLPWPEYVPLEEAERVARWAAATVQRHERCFISVQVSRALRIALAAEAAGLDLSGAVFMIAGEPPTQAKVEAIQRSGARCFPTYGMAEVGRVGIGCANPYDHTDLHLLRDAFALVPYEHQPPTLDSPVNAFCLTTLLPTTPKIMFNVIVDDYGIVEERACGCPLEHYGYTTHLRQIRSFHKLTGEGVTLVGSDMVHILESVLPARFGGSALDFQLLEAEDEQGFTRLFLLIHPRLAIADEQEVLSLALEALGQASPASHSARSVWQQARTLQIRRQEPVWTARGKFNSIVRSRSLGESLSPEKEN